MSTAAGPQPKKNKEEEATNKTMHSGKYQKVDLFLTWLKQFSDSLLAIL